MAISPSKLASLPSVDEYNENFMMQNPQYSYNPQSPTTQTDNKGISWTPEAYAQQQKDVAKFFPTVLTNTRKIEETVPKLNAKANEIVQSSTSQSFPSDRYSIGSKGEWIKNVESSTASTLPPTSYSDIYSDISSKLDTEPQFELSPEQKQLFEMQQTNLDAQTKAALSTIDLQMRQRESLLSEQQRIGTRTLQSSLFQLGGGRYAKSSAQALLDAKNRSDVQSLYNLQSDYQLAQAKVLQAQREGNYALMEKKLNTLETLRKEKLATASKIAESIQKQNEEIRKTTIQATRDAAVADLYDQGVTTPQEILNVLNESAAASGYSSSDFTLEEIGKALKVLKPDQNLTGLDSDYRTYSYLKEIGDPAVSGLNYLEYKTAVANATRKAETTKEITISNENKNKLLGVGFSSQEIDLIEEDVRQFGLDEVLKRITDDNQKQVLQEVYGQKEKVTREYLEKTITSKDAYEGLKDAYTEKELKKFADEAGISSMWTGQETDIENYLNSEDAKKKYVDLLYEQYKEAGMAEDSPQSNFNSGATPEKTTGQYSTNSMNTNTTSDRQTYIESDKRNPFVEFLLNIKDKLPIFESRAGKAMKQDALNAYPFTDQAQSMIKNMTKIRDDSPQVDFALRLIKEKKWNRNNPLDNSPKEISILNPNYNYPYYGYTENPEYGRQEISIRNPQSDVISHELIHSLFRTTNVDADDFNSEWEKLKGTPIYKFVDDQLQGEVYSDINSKQLASERFAYIGQYAGQGGLENIPEPLKKFFSRVFK